MPKCKECAYYMFEFVDPYHGVCGAESHTDVKSGTDIYSIKGERVEASQECTKPEKFVSKKEMKREERLRRSY